VPLPRNAGRTGTSPRPNSRRRGSKAAKLCGAICYEAFKTITEAHHFTPDFPSVDVPVELLTWMLGHAGFYAVVAELDGKVVGSNFLDERNCIEASASSD
jgi:hypothetical protein